MGMSRCQSRRRIADQGFSLVEVLVCIALLAVISVPVFASIKTAVKLNFNAHNTQMLTTYLQEELEIVKALSVESYTKRMAGKSITPTEITDGSTFTAIYDRAVAAQNSFGDLSSLTAEQKKELFTPFYFEQSPVEVGGETYRMRVFYEPAPYSVANTGGSWSSSDINISSLTGMVEADASKYPVIMDEINQYEGNNGTTDTIIKDLQARLNALGIDKTDAEVTAQMKKQTDVSVTMQPDGAGGKQVCVTCDVTYSCDAAEIYYRVYNGYYPYAPTVAQKAADPAIMDGVGETSGGNVFIFAKAYQPQGIAVTESAHCNNVINITGGNDADAPVNVYLIRGHVLDSTNTYKTDYNFDEVNINSVNFLNSADMLARGECNFGDGKFVTNIHSASWNRSGNKDSDESELEKLVGGGDYDARCYQVTIELIDAAGNVAASVDSTKVDR